MKFRFLLAATATFTPFQAGPSVLTNENQGAATACLEKAVLQERLHEIPGSLKQALSLAESGRRDENTELIVTWPWTIMAKASRKLTSAARK